MLLSPSSFFLARTPTRLNVGRSISSMRPGVSAPAVPIRTPRRMTRLRSSSDRDDKAAFGELNYEDLKNSKFLGSEVVQQEITGIMQQFMQVSSMFPKFFDYDVYGMKVYIVQVEQLVDRLQTFMFRAKITDDPAAKQILNNINVQLMAAGQSFETMNSAMLANVQSMRKVCDELERIELSGDVALLKQTRQQLKDFAMRTNPAARADYSQIVQDPEVAEALRDPNVLRIYQEVAADPSKFKSYIGTKHENFLRKVGLADFA